VKEGLMDRISQELKEQLVEEDQIERAFDDPILVNRDNSA
jgi:hypothetical protein